MTREDLIVKLCSWFILGCVLVFPVGFIKGECVDTYVDGLGYSYHISRCVEGYLYRWKYSKYDSRVGYSVWYDVANFYQDALILSLVSPFILEPARLVLRRLRPKDTASYRYIGPHWKRA